MNIGEWGASPKWSLLISSGELYWSTATFNSNSQIFEAYVSLVAFVNTNGRLSKKLYSS